MSATVICQGCGQAFDVPEGYARNKIQCPGCGVICPVPAGSGSAPPRARRSPPRDLEAEAAEALAEPVPQRASAPAVPIRTPTPAAPPDPWGQQAVPLAREMPVREEGERGDPEPV